MDNKPWYAAMPDAVRCELSDKLAIVACLLKGELARGDVVVPFNKRNSFALRLETLAGLKAGQLPGTHFLPGLKTDLEAVANTLPKGQRGVFLLFFWLADCQRVMGREFSRKPRYIARRDCWEEMPLTDADRLAGVRKRLRRVDERLGVFADQQAA